MSNQVGLLPPQTREEALADLARHPAVGGWKNLAVRLKPKLSDDPEEAGKWLHRAVDEGKRDVFHDKHMRRAIRLGNDIGCHVLWHWYAQDVRYQPGDPINSKSRRLLLLEERERISQRDRQIQEQLDELDKLDAVHELRERRGQ